MKSIFHVTKHEERREAHLVFSSRRNVPVNSSQVSQNGIWVCHFGINARSHAITGFLAVSFPLNPFQPSHFGTLSPIHYLPVRILQNPSKSSLARVFAVSPSFNQALARFMLYIFAASSFFSVGCTERLTLPIILPAAGGDVTAQ